MNWAAIIVIGALVGFLAGLFGKGGSAIATPMLHAAGVTAFVAVAAPLPATIPSTLVALAAYRGSHLIDRQVVRWSVAVGVPCTVAGAVATRWIGGGFLITVTDVLIAGLGLRLLLRPGAPEERVRETPGYRTRLVLVAAVVGLAAGLLANSGGFLLAPLYLTVLRLPVKAAFACSLAVSAVLAIPGTIAHAALGHIDWTVVALFGVASVPLSYVGARVALRANSDRLERLFGATLVALGVGFLVFSR
jgi:hypothetical protein